MVGMENIVNFVVFVENSQIGKFNTTIVGTAQTEETFVIEPDATMYDVTVVAYDTCQKSSSTTVSVIVQRESKSLAETSTSLLTDLAPSICTSTGVIHSPHSVAPPPPKCENLENNQGIQCNSGGCVICFFHLQGAVLH